VKDIRRATRRQFSAEEKIRIVLEGLRGEESIAELYRRKGIVPNQAIYSQTLRHLSDRQHPYRQTPEPGCGGPRARYGEDRPAGAGH
jgi:transposase-like protein